MNKTLNSTIRLLTPLEAMSASHLTFPSFLHLLARSGDPGVVAVGAFLDSRPVGLALAVQAERPGPAQVASLFVGKPYRGQGLGKALLTAAQQELARRGSTQVRLEYSTAMPARPALEGLLRRLGWTEPETWMLVCRADERARQAPFFQAPLFTRIAQGLAGAEVFPWEDLRPAEKEALLAEQQTEHPWFPAYLNPFQEEPTLVRSVSLGLRLAGTVVGWLITHRITPTVVRYSWGFVHPDVAHRGAYVLLLRAALWRHLEILPQGSQAIWTVLLRDREMARFVRRRFAPWLLSLSEVRTARKALAPPNEPRPAQFGTIEEMATASVGHSPFP
jgi:GNAT superfamily N-acetyltransferase